MSGSSQKGSVSYLAEWLASLAHILKVTKLWVMSMNLNAVYILCVFNLFEGFIVYIAQFAVLYYESSKLESGTPLFPVVAIP
jgi:hypothetical protein